MKGQCDVLRFAVLFLLIALTLTQGAETKPDGALYTKAEQAALNKFRPMVQVILLEDWMRADEYLILWLRDSRLNLNQAKANLMKTMEWRKENKISTIRQEDFSKFRKEFPIFLEGFDKDGRPIMIYLFGFFNLRKLVLAGQVEEFQRYMTRNFEEAHAKIRDVGRANVSQIVELYDLNGFNPRQHLCLQCLSIYSYFVQIAEAHYPQLTYKTFMINVPTIFEQVLQVVRPFFSQHTKDTLFIFASNKDEWSKVLLEHIPRDQLLRQFGGSRKIKPGDAF